MQVVLYQPQSVTPPSHRAPLSLLALSAPLRRAGHRVDLVDGNLCPDPTARALELIGDEPVLIAMTVHPGRQLQSALRDVRTLHRAAPEVPIIWGGYFASMHPETLLTEPALAGWVVGQGERAILSICEALQAGITPPAHPGVWWRGPDGGLAHSTPELDPYSITEWGGLDYDLIDIEDYLVPSGLGQRTFNTITAYGCPYRCNFCAIISVYHSRVALTPVELVRQQLTPLVRQHRIDGIEFHDPTFFLGERRLLGMLDVIEPLGVRWSAQGRVDTVLRYSDDTWRRIRDSGCDLIYFGAESGDDELLAEMQKDTAVSQVLEVAERTRRFGLRPEFYFCFGNPSDPDRSIRKNIELIYRIKDIHPDADICPTIYTPTPQPGMAEDAAALGFRFPRTAAEWAEPPWVDLGFMQKPLVPWLGRERVDLIRDFQLVLNTAFPRHADLRLNALSRPLSRWLGQRRFRQRSFRDPWEIKLFNAFVDRLAPRWRGHRMSRGV